MHLVFVDRLLYIKLRSVFKNISASTKNIESPGLLIDEKNERFIKLKGKANTIITVVTPLIFHNACQIRFFQ